MVPLRLSYEGGVTDQRLDALAEFREYDATDARVMVDKATGKSRGFGFVFFGDEKGMRSAIEALHGTEWEGRRISVTRAIPQNETAPGTPAAVLMGGREGRGGRRVSAPRQR